MNVWRHPCSKHVSVIVSDILLKTILIVRKETRCRHIGYSYQLTARVLLYAPSHRQDNTYHSLCHTSRVALTGTRNSSMGPPHEGSIRRPTAPWANALPLSYVPLSALQAGHGKVSMASCWRTPLQRDSVGPSVVIHVHRSTSKGTLEGGIALNQVIVRSEFEVHLKLLRSECNEGCDWCIYVTAVTCADTLTSTLCIQ